MRALPMGDRAVLVELASLNDVMALFARARGAGLGGVEELVPAARTLLVRFDPAVVSAAGVVDWLRTLVRRSGGPGGVTVAGVNVLPKGGPAVQDAGVRRVEIPVQYTGEDLDEVAHELGVTRGELIERHTGRDYLAAFSGFAPGFVYLSGGDPSFDTVSRRAVPRTRVPAGSVAVAGGYCAVYPADSPGGWRLLGATPLRMWDLARAVPALIQPGVRVRFRDVASRDIQYSLPRAARGAVDAGDAPGADDVRAASHTVGAGAVSPSGGMPDAADSRGAATVAPQDEGAPRTGAWLEVLAPGLQTLVQDLGRPGQAALGVSGSGALDRAALRRANCLVGNAEGAPVLENVLGDLQLVCRGQAVVAVTGAPVGVTLTMATGMRVPAAAGVALAMRDGDTLRLGRPRAGLRCYVAVRGGWDVPPVLGSASTDVLGKLGPAPLRRGDCLRVGEGAPAGPVSPVPGGSGAVAGPLPTGPLVRAAAGRSPRGAKKGAPPLETVPYPRAGQAVCLDIVLGPRDDWFDAQALKSLVEQDWVVTPQSNRVGLRLEGGRPLARSRTGELQSEGMIAGAIEVPPSGQPVLFLADHPLTGGYPVIAVVVDRDLDQLAQVPPGALLRFRRVA